MGLNFRKNNGFTLVEMALVMIISGLMFSIIAAAYKVQLRQNEQEILFENAQEMRGGIFEFISIMGRYPCPADPTLGPGDADYGLEDCSRPKIGTGWDRDMDGTEDTFMVGAVPINTLLDPDLMLQSPVTARNTIDPWSNKYLYAVSSALTDDSTFNEYLGTLAVVDEYGDSVLQFSSSAHAVLVSHGKNGRGARSLNGAAVDPFVLLPPTGPSPPPGAVRLSEIENGNNDAIFLAGLINESGLFYNDDFTHYLIFQRSEIWPVVGGNGDENNPIYYAANTNPGNVGIGLDDPGEKLDIAGSIRAAEVRTDSICDTAGQNCMPLDALAGEMDDMECDKGEVVTYIADNRVYCEQVFAAPGTTLSCPAGMYLRGFSNTGSLDCLPVN